MVSITESLNLMKQSFSVLFQEKKLLVFPFISLVVFIALLASFVLPFIFAGLSDSPVLVYAIIFLFYLFSYFTAIFFNSALYHAVRNKLEGKQVSIGESMSFAVSNAGNILLWALVAATVGLILNILNSMARDGRGLGALVGRIAVSLLGAAWSIATFFVVPIMIFEKTSPFDALKGSIALIKQTWGGQLIQALGFGIIFFVLYLLGIGILILGGSPGSGTFMLVLGLVIVYWLSLFLIQSALTAIFTTALYLYAQKKQVSAFNQDIMAKAFI